MTFVSGKMATQQQSTSADPYRLRYSSTTRKLTKPGHVVTFSSQKSYASTTSKDSSDDEDDEYFNGRSQPQNPSSGRQNFDVIKTIHEGKFSKILLAKLDGPGISRERMVLKAVEKQSTASVHMFYREMDYNYLLSPHENVVTSYNVVLRWKNYYIFAQEYAPAGDLGRYLKKYGKLTEAKTKIVARQLSSALDFIHGLNLVHQGVIPENILVFNRECSLIKLSDFCGMRPTGSLVVKGNLENYYEDDDGQQISSLLAYTPPEICTKLPQEKYLVHPSIDVWSVGIIIWACLSGTGQGPWQSADKLRDPGFRQFYEWAKKKSLKVPDAFQPLSYRLLRLLKKLLEPNPEKRCKAREVLKYLKDDWVSKNTAAVLTKLGVSRSESCTFGTLGTTGGAGGFGRVNSQKYARRGSACPRVKSEVRKTRRQESSNSSGSSNNNNTGGVVGSSPRPNSKTPGSNRGAGGTDSESNRSFKISCVLETTRIIPLSNSKSSPCIIPPPSPTPPTPQQQQQNPLSSKSAQMGSLLSTQKSL